MDVSIYRSKVDWWLAVILIVSVLTPATLGVYTIATGVWSEGWALLGSSVVLGAFVCSIAVPVTYALTEKELVIRSGLLRKRIPYARIVAANPSRSPRSSLAWSLDRIELTLNNHQQVLISPVRKDEFLSKLMNRISRAPVALTDLGSGPP